MTTATDLASATTDNGATGGAITAAETFLGTALTALGQLGSALNSAASSSSKTGVDIAQAITDLNTVTPPPVTKPGPITGLTAIPGDSEVSLGWTADTSGGTVADYSVTWTGPTGGAVDAQVGLKAQAVGLTNGQSYTFTVTASNAAGSASATVTSTPFAATPPPPSGDIIAVFRRALSSWPGVTTNPRSATYIAEIPVGVKASGYSIGLNNGVNGLSYIRVPNSKDPSLIPMTVALANSAKDFRSSTGSQVLLPPGVWTRATPNTDSPLAVYYEDTDRLVEFWQAALNYTTKTLTAAWGGGISAVSASDGVYPNPFGVTASGLTMAGTYFTQQDAANRLIAHPLAMCFETLGAGNVLPADRWDNGSGDNAVHEGAWIQLAANAVIPSSWPMAEQMVCTAARDYGIIVTDFGGAYMVQCEAPQPGQVDQIGALFGGLPEYSVLPGFLSLLSGARVLTPPAHWANGNEAF